MTIPLNVVVFSLRQNRLKALGFEPTHLHLSYFSLMFLVVRKQTRKLELSINRITLILGRTNLRNNVRKKCLTWKLAKAFHVIKFLLTLKKT